jgi:phage terminase small subunit
MTPKRERFIFEYLIDLNATQAAIRAGYSKKTAYSSGQRLLKNVEVAEAIHKANETILYELEITAERVLSEIARLAYFDPRKLFHADGSLKNIHELDEDTARAIVAFDFEKLYRHFAKGQSKPIGTVAKIKFADKGANLERLGKHLKLFTDKIEHSGTISYKDAVEEGWDRVIKR